MVTSQVLPNCAAFISRGPPTASFASHVLFKIRTKILFVT